LVRAGYHCDEAISQFNAENPSMGFFLKLWIASQRSLALIYGNEIEKEFFTQRLKRGLIHLGV